MATRTNLCINPSIEINTTGWIAYDANTTISRDTSQFHLGTASIKGLCSVATTYYGPCYNATGLTIGVTYTASGYVRNFAGTNTVSLWASGAGGVSPSVVLDSTWKRLSVTFTATATSHYMMFLDAAGTLNDAFFVDSVLVEQTDFTRDYFDGSFPFSSWSGTAWASTSTWTFDSFNVELWDSGSAFDVRLAAPVYLDPTTEHWGFLAI